MAFHDTLSEPQRHLTRRLESFGDVVFGFSMSQLALQLVLPNTPQDLIHPIRFAYYFGTFTALAFLWFVYHRMLSGPFVPLRLDVVLVFVFLAFVTIVPYAMYTWAHLNSHVEWIRAGFGAYLVCSVGTTVPSSIVAWRNLRRGWYHVDEADRRKLWRRVVSVTTVAAMMLVALVVDVAVPIDLAWGLIPPPAIVMMCLPLGMRGILALYGRRVPSPAALRIPPKAPAG